MINDIDKLMLEQNVDALLVTGPAFHNPTMTYLTGGGHITRADLIKKRGEKPVLYCGTMERDEAARTGLITRSLAAYMIPAQELSGGDPILAQALRYQAMLTELGVTSGRVALYGQADAGQAFAIYSTLQKLMPELELFGELERPLLLAAMATKGPEEVERIRRMGRITTEVIGEVADYITSRRVKDEVLLQEDGVPLTIGEVKRRIDLWLVERGAENPEGTIFAIGRDAGVPHSTGINSDTLRLGKTIVFDIFPREAGGGYFYDITRTWCLGYATDEALKLYEQVLSVFQQVKATMKPGLICRELQNLTCDLFEAQGHATLRTDPQATEGFIHGLGHGVGLHIHENPFFRASGPDSERLEPGVVVTVEPGLYYPERGMGVRLEDTMYCCPDGAFEELAQYPLDLILPMR